MQPDAPWAGSTSDSDSDSDSDGDDGQVPLARTCASDSDDRAGTTSSYLC